LRACGTHRACSALCACGTPCARPWATGRDGSHGADRRPDEDRHVVGIAPSLLRSGFGFAAFYMAEGTFVPVGGYSRSGIRLQGVTVSNPASLDVMSDARGRRSFVLAFQVIHMAESASLGLVFDTCTRGPFAFASRMIHIADPPAFGMHFNSASRPPSGFGVFALGKSEATAGPPIVHRRAATGHCARPLAVAAAHPTAGDLTLDASRLSSCHRMQAILIAGRAAPTGLLCRPPGIVRSRLGAALGNPEQVCGWRNLGGQNHGATAPPDSFPRFSNLNHALQKPIHRKSLGRMDRALFQWTASNP
jgi:hypothetical protein